MLGCEKHLGVKTAHSDSACRDCRSLYFRGYYVKNRDKFREYRKKYRNENKEVFAKREREYALRNPDKTRARMIAHDQRRRTSPDFAFNLYQRNSISRNLEFGLSYGEFMSFLGQPCAYCGDVQKNIGIDRIDNSVGYIDGNVVPCCGVCNRAKSAMAASEFVKMCRKVYLAQEKYAFPAS